MFDENSKVHDLDLLHTSFTLKLVNLHFYHTSITLK
ncbi:hypothetical protein EZS27_013319 [termite gut metagenome]|uniref:Uncharacterized protein n=1 Tax=termite gut metagenome TaxID=433724 RepID=A0A5J4S018_9ZZZZ